jgi:hypothetical protein
MRSLIALILAALLASPVRFADVDIDAKAIAFVCDGSRWTRAKVEGLAEALAVAVDAMRPDQHFAVIFFADEKASGFEDGKPVAATDENKRKLRDWLRDVELGDKSTPAVGLTRAFEAKPEAVVFISSGEFEDFDGVEAHVAKLNTDKAVRVHAIGFFRNEKEDDSRPFVTFMQKLAEQNGGQFKTVYADELKRGAN